MLYLWEEFFLCHHLKPNTIGPLTFNSFPLLCVKGENHCLVLKGLKSTFPTLDLASSLYIIYVSGRQDYMLSSNLFCVSLH